MATSRAYLLALAFVSTTLLGCASGFTATSDYDPEHNFSNHKTWAWISDNPMTVGSAAKISNPLVEPRIMAAIESNLSAKGFTQVSSSDKADFVVAFTVGARDKIKVDSYPTYYGGYGYPGAWGGRYYGMGVGVGYGTETRVREYTNGMLAVDIFDVAERKPMWHGYAEKSITSSDRKNMVETINAAVTAVLADFPPQ